MLLESDQGYGKRRCELLYSSVRALIIAFPLYFQVKDLGILYKNRAAVYLKFNDFQNAVDDCTKSLECVSTGRLSNEIFMLISLAPWGLIRHRRKIAAVGLLYFQHIIGQA